MTKRQRDRRAKRQRHRRRLDQASGAIDPLAFVVSAMTAEEARRLLLMFLKRGELK